MSADAGGEWRRTRSSPRSGKPATWRRGPANPLDGSECQESLVNIGDTPLGVYWGSETFQLALGPPGSGS
jgi:hypothetical protein